MSRIGIMPQTDASPAFHRSPGKDSFVAATQHAASHLSPSTCNNCSIPCPTLRHLLVSPPPVYHHSHHVFTPKNCHVSMLTKLEIPSAKSSTLRLTSEPGFSSPTKMASNKTASIPSVYQHQVSFSVLRPSGTSVSQRSLMPKIPGRNQDIPQMAYPQTLHQAQSPSLICISPCAANISPPVGFYVTASVGQTQALKYREKAEAEIFSEYMDTFHTKSLAKSSLSECHSLSCKRVTDCKFHTSDSAASLLSKLKPPPPLQCLTSLPGSALKFLTTSNPTTSSDSVSGTSTLQSVSGSSAVKSCNSNTPGAVQSSVNSNISSSKISHSVVSPISVHRSSVTSQDFKQNPFLPTSSIGSAKMSNSCAVHESVSASLVLQNIYTSAASRVPKTELSSSTPKFSDLSPHSITTPHQCKVTQTKSNTKTNDISSEHSPAKLTDSSYVTCMENGNQQITSITLAYDISEQPSVKDFNSEHATTTNSCREFVSNHEMWMKCCKDSRTSAWFSSSKGLKTASTWCLTPGLPISRSLSKSASQTIQNVTELSESEKLPTSSKSDRFVGISHQLKNKDHHDSTCTGGGKSKPVSRVCVPKVNEKSNNFCQKIENKTLASAIFYDEFESIANNNNEVQTNDSPIEMEIKNTECSLTADLFNRIFQLPIRKAKRKDSVKDTKGGQQDCCEEMMSSWLEEELRNTQSATSSYEDRDVRATKCTSKVLAGFEQSAAILVEESSVRGCKQAEDTTEHCRIINTKQKPSMEVPQELKGENKGALGFNELPDKSANKDSQQEPVSLTTPDKAKNHTITNLPKEHEKLVPPKSTLNIPEKAKTCKLQGNCDGKVTGVNLQPLTRNTATPVMKNDNKMYCPVFPQNDDDHDNKHTSITFLEMAQTLGIVNISSSETQISRNKYKIINRSNGTQTDGTTESNHTSGIENSTLADTTHLTKNLSDTEEEIIKLLHLASEKQNEKPVVSVMSSVGVGHDSRPDRSMMSYKKDLMIQILTGMDHLLQAALTQLEILTVLCTQADVDCLEQELECKCQRLLVNSSQCLETLQYMVNPLRNVLMQQCQQKQSRHVSERTTPLGFKKVNPDEEKKITACNELDISDKENSKKKDIESCVSATDLEETSQYASQICAAKTVHHLSDCMSMEHGIKDASTLSSPAVQRSKQKGNTCSDGGDLDSSKKYATFVNCSMKEKSLSILTHVNKHKSKVHLKRKPSALNGERNSKNIQHKNSPIAFKESCGSHNHQNKSKHALSCSTSTETVSAKVHSRHKHESASSTTVSRDSESVTTKAIPRWNKQGTESKVKDEYLKDSDHRMSERSWSIIGAKRRKTVNSPDDYSRQRASKCSKRFLVNSSPESEPPVKSRKTNYTSPSTYVSKDASLHNKECHNRTRKSGRQRVSTQSSSKTSHVNTKKNSPGDELVEDGSPEEVIAPFHTRGLSCRQECFLVLDSVFNHDSSHDFRSLPDTHKFPGFHHYVKYPMYLSLVACRLRTGIITHLDDFVADMRRIFWNARLYNKFGQKKMRHVTQVESYFNEKLLQVFPDHDFSGITGRPKVQHKRIDTPCSSDDTYIIPSEIRQLLG